MENIKNPVFNFISSENIPSHNELLKAKQINCGDNTFNEVIISNEEKEPKVEVPIPQHVQNNDPQYINSYPLQKINYTLERPFQSEQMVSEKQRKKFFCSCKKSKCLKLYCDCFANSEYCINCSCCDCENVIDNKDQIKKCFEDVVDKNPLAMKTSINLDKDFGCNCTKSNCLKKYCECYKAGKHCNETCRCRDCDNLPKKEEEINNENHPKQEEKIDYSLFDNGYKTKPLTISIEQLYNTFGFEKTQVCIDDDIQIQKKEFLHSLQDSPKKNNESKYITVRIIDQHSYVEVPKYMLSEDVLKEIEKVKRIKDVFNQNVNFDDDSNNSNSLDKNNQFGDYDSSF